MRWGGFVGGMFDVLWEGNQVSEIRFVEYGAGENDFVCVYLVIYGSLQIDCVWLHNVGLKGTKPNQFVCHLVEKHKTVFFSGRCQRSIQIGSWDY